MANEPTTGKTVLVVDDNVMSRAVIERRVKRDGYGVISASSGQEALDAVAQHSVDLIFLDMVMPGMDGMDVLKSLKNNPQHKDIPIIVISGLDDVDAPEKATSAGAADFLHKPVMANTLSIITNEYLGDGAGSADREVTAPSESSVEDSPVIDTAFINQLRADYGAETTLNFISRFEELASDQRASISAAAERSDLGALSQTSHALKGGARTLGLARLAAACRDLERACDTGNLEEATSRAQFVDDLLTEALVALQTSSQGA